MGQYFRAVNLDKKEWLDPWSLGVGAKFWEWCANREAAVFPYLLRASSEADAGGDLKTHDSSKVRELMEKGLSYEEAVAQIPTYTWDYAGRWAGDRILLVGDYDDSGLWDEVETSPDYTEISAGVLEEFNRLIGPSDFRIGPREVREAVE